jgi:hypothetical protein
MVASKRHIYNWQNAFRFFVKSKYTSHLERPAILQYTCSTAGITAYTFIVIKDKALSHS